MILAWTLNVALVALYIKSTAYGAGVVHMWDVPLSNSLAIVKVRLSTHFYFYSSTPFFINLTPAVSKHSRHPLPTPHPLHQALHPPPTHPSLLPLPHRPPLPHFLHPHRFQRPLLRRNHHLHHIDVFARRQDLGPYSEWDLFRRGDHHFCECGD